MADFVAYDSTAEDVRGLVSGIYAKVLKSATKPKPGSLALWAVRACTWSVGVTLLLLAFKSLIGDNIDCVTGFEEMEHKAIETYCYITATFTLVDQGQPSAHPGVGAPSAGRGGGGGDAEASNGTTTTHHDYYQWVAFVLVLQIIMFYFPNWLWARMDKGYFQEVLCHLDKVHLHDDNRDQLLKTSAIYFTSKIGKHLGYSLRFLACEFVALLVLVVNLLLTNVLLGGQFLQFGPAAFASLNKPYHDFDNPINLVFPKVAKCTWHKFGPSGTIENRDAMCVLPLNVFYEKIYLALWVVFVGSTVLCGVAVLSHLLLLLFPSLRNAYLNFASSKDVTRQTLPLVLPKCNYGDWFLLLHLGTNMRYFPEWLVQVKEELQK